jgi:hypothetical protein
MDFEKFYSSLTPNERAYFIGCTDIFHDKPYDVIGRPSLSNQLQNTTQINLSQTYSARDFTDISDPPGKWDLHITSLPFITKQVMQGVNDYGYSISQPANVTNRDFGGLCIWGVNSGETTWIPQANHTPLTLNVNEFLFPGATDNVTPPVKRLYYEILSIGFETVDVSPELLKQGTQVRYRMATQGRKSQFAVNDGSGNWTGPRPQMYAYPMPPSSTSLATNIPGSIVTEAKHGSYQMHTIQDSVSDYYVTGNEQVCFTNPGNGADRGNSWMSASYINATYDYDKPLVRGDFDIVGVYYSGLGPDSSITVRYRIILSTVPSHTDPQLLALAKLSPDANYKLDSLLSHVQADFPAGVDVRENAHGDWFKKVLKIAKQVLPKAIPVVKDLIVGDYVGAATNTVKALTPQAKAQEDKTRAVVAAAPAQSSAIALLQKEIAKLKADVAALKARHAK